jgi:hypothetical protein
MSKIGIGDVVAEHGAANGGRCFDGFRLLFVLSYHCLYCLWFGIAHDDTGLVDGVVDDFAQENGVGG